MFDPYNAPRHVNSKAFIAKLQKKYDEQHEEKLIDKLKGWAKPNCSKCYGRGYVGITQEGVAEPCRCAMKAKGP